MTPVVRVLNESDCVGGPKSPDSHPEWRVKPWPPAGTRSSGPVSGRPERSRGRSLEGSRPLQQVDAPHDCLDDGIDLAETGFIPSPEPETTSR
jgi:hypothetical protein